MTISLTHSHQHAQVPTYGKEKNHLLVELKGNATKQVERSPINLAIVLDRSGSMTGNPLHYCKEAVKFVVSQLTDKDLLTVVVFDNEVETVFGPENVTHKDLLKHKIDQISTRGLTNLSGGLIQGCQHVLKQKEKDYVNRVIVLSDGQANRGVTDFNQLMMITDEYQSAGVTISTIGVSEHFDEEVMEGISEHGKGNFYFIDEVEGIPAIFAEELEGLLSVIAQNVTLAINPKDGVEVHKVFGYEPKQEEEGLKLNLGDMYANEVKSILVAYGIQAKPEGIHDIFDLQWSFVDITDGVKECKCKANVPIHYTTDLKILEAKPNAHVEKQVQITKSATIINEAMDFFDIGDIEAGKQLLHKQAVNMSIIAKEMNDEELLSESKILMEKLNNFEYSKKTRKELHHQRYRQMKRKK
ncbi:hypothetical protein CIB95_09215 [Lottiidibacillus patelloidae]|uniref:VWFA domain-containing protein n=1 Tax=Lottiidibacillus patelloidae TaxID=2670334 RepID=A0A263BTB5_9BACI|nr:VWA domain-containing protein [Lottiidibacillus patelloidae]OZM56939.1 hypothetical protein CIB95_09215 [Lottiidibacillus patelloidae]